MGWVRNDDDMLDHAKWRRAIRDGGDGVLLLWTRLTSWCSRRLTDGVVPGDMVDEVAQIGASKARAKQLRALVDARLLAWCDPDEDTLSLRRGTAEPSPRPRRELDVLVVVGYLQRNPFRAEVLAERDRRAQAQKNRRLGENVTGHAETSPDPPVPECNGVPARPGPARPDSTPNSDRPSVGARARDPNHDAEAAPCDEPLEAEPSEAKPDEPDPPKARRRPWKRVPSDWEPNAAHRDRARKLGWTRERFERQAEKYRLHDFKAAKTDPDRTFHRWIIEAEERDPTASSARPQLGRGRNADALDYAFALATGEST